MQCNIRNIYKNARRVAGMTQERWAEAIGVSAESVRGYETGRQTPSEGVVKTMCEISGISQLAYWHLCQTSALANDILPGVAQLPLPQAAVQLILAMRQFAAQETELLELSADGVIDDAERVDWGKVVCALDGVIQAALQVKFAEEAEA